ncbi:MAG: phytoene/squalene synthase family protein [Candidatus Micrarchaeota archaeon]|nr:phytoene/squalene synthase family protein [Candidatus Micrarchaeota archaeon]
MQASESDFQRCKEVLSKSSSTFFLASRMLPAQQKQAFWAVYAFCRATDDIADEGDFGRQQRARMLAEWKQDLLSALAGKRSASAVIRAFSDTMRAYGIPVSLPMQLIEGVSMDISRTRFHSFRKLRRYCYCVASVVGLMLLYVMGVKSRRAQRYAISLGIAMQLTNILRDISEDLASGRLYLPLSELSAFGLKPSDIGRKMGRRKLESFRRFMRFQIRRARHYYSQALFGIRLLPKKLQAAISSAALLYLRILDDIETRGFDVFSGGLAGRE